MLKVITNDKQGTGMIRELNDFYRDHQEMMVNGVFVRYFDSTYRLEGAADNPKSTVIAMHGVATSGYLYRHIINRFGASVRMIVPDLPGFGRSAKRLPWAAKYKYYMQWFEGFFNSLNIPPHEKVHFIGHDFGALLALGFSVEHPQHIASIFCTNTCIHFEHTIPTPWLGISLAPIIGQRIGRLCAREPLLSMIFKRVFHSKPSQSTVEAYLDVYKDKDARNVLMNFMHHLPSMAGIMWTLRRQLKQLQCPVHLVFGGEDPLMRRGEARAMAEILSKGSYRNLSNIGHFPNEEAHEAVCEELHAHLLKLGVSC